MQTFIIKVLAVLYLLWRTVFTRSNFERLVFIVVWILATIEV